MPRGPPSGSADATTIVMLPRPSPDPPPDHGTTGAPIVRRGRRRHALQRLPGRDNRMGKGRGRSGGICPADTLRCRRRHMSRKGADHRLSLQPAASHRTWTAPAHPVRIAQRRGSAPATRGTRPLDDSKATLGALAHPRRSRRAIALRRQRSSPSSGSNRAWHGPRRGRPGLRPGSSSRHAGPCPISRAGKPHDAHSPAAHQTGNSPTASRESSIGQVPRVETGRTMMRPFRTEWHTLTARYVTRGAPSKTEPGPEIC